MAVVLGKCGRRWVNDTVGSENSEIDMNNLLKNWKTTSAGAVMILGSIVHLIFAVKAGRADEATWTTSLTAILAGVGLMFAGDGATSAQAHEETKQLVANLNTKIDATATAVKTGDTSFIDKATAVANPAPKP